ncbi:hypothetical protein HPB48_001825 [Haemaphysalis longicornis]|uniref:Cuticle protein n=1 Tax=Haemaphysalis longicornis TaxID=44386 RepID=A0A9J6G677_HAELO|nr:hypothetical protein HPB48_001825 [Haemaphysalis longicornis]
MWCPDEPRLYRYPVPRATEDACPVFLPQTYAPQPYQFGYETQDEYGNRQSRHEQDAGDGVKTGMYGFRDASGLYRQVQYVADHRGFRAWVKTNEPGTQDSAPASARIESQQPHERPKHTLILRRGSWPREARFVRLVSRAWHVVAGPPPGDPAPTFVASPLRKVPVHHSLYPISAVSARHGPIEHAFSQQVPVVRQPSFRRLAARPSAVGPLVAPVAAAAQGPSLTAKVRRRKPAEFFKKSIINKPRANKSRNVRVRVAQTTKDGGARSDEVPVYKD